jgi:opacity protein-like surface antigen
MKMSDRQKKKEWCARSVSRNAVLRISLLILPFLTLLAEPSRAQVRFQYTHGEWEATVFAGGSFIGSHVHQTPVEGQSSRAVGLSYATGSQLGGRIADNHWRHWGAAFEYSFSNQPINFTNLSDATPSVGLGQAIHRFNYDMLYYPFDRHYRLRPYAFAGPGVALFWIKGSAKDAAAAQGIQLSDPWKFAMNWGGGVKFLVVRQVAANFQFSDNISGVPGYGLPETGRFVSGTYVPGFRPNGLLNNWLISAGFTFQWDDR